MSKAPQFSSFAKNNSNAKSTTPWAPPGLAATKIPLSALPPHPQVDQKTSPNMLRKELVPGPGHDAQSPQVRKLLQRLSEANWRLLQLPPPELTMAWFKDLPTTSGALIRDGCPYLEGVSTAGSFIAIKRCWH